MDGKPRLVEPSAALRRAANVVIVFGFPWHTSEAQVRKYLLQVHPAAPPVTVRLYTNPTNGSSRGMCFIEYGAKHGGTTLGSVKGEPTEDAEDESVVAAVKKEIEETPFGRQYLTAVLYHLTNQGWDRGGRLPELPTDPPATRGGWVEGYGDEGFSVRCGAVLGLANTVTAGGMASMQALRKRLRAEAEAE
ncbi:hypothetical protein TRSC58_03514 [Trypanosoma rangeli SC58]|uniref:RRM domain-containing protein n=1 Tax=Trypanosoma rangeli SC58 TaxID=429131 RepID=A0A061J040_TRYRA|nr:hypothetical protein TRSC58_03514 [Trypanosoma rangeli SC58]